MIFADVAEIEKISHILSALADRADEALSVLRRTLAEMQNDVEFGMYPQHTTVCNSVSSSIDSLARGNDILQTLKGVLANAVREYEDAEESNVNALNRMADLLSHIQTGMFLSTLPGQIPTVANENQPNSLDRVRGLVSASAAEMQLTNIAVISKVIKEEYGIDQVTDMPGKGVG